MKTTHDLQVERYIEPYVAPATPTPEPIPDRPLKMTRAEQREAIRKAFRN